VAGNLFSRRVSVRLLISSHQSVRGSAAAAAAAIAVTMLSAKDAPADKSTRPATRRSGRSGAPVGR